MPDPAAQTGWEPGLYVYVDFGVAGEPWREQLVLAEPGGSSWLTCAPERHVFEDLLMSPLLRAMIVESSAWLPHGGLSSVSCQADSLSASPADVLERNGERAGFQCARPGCPYLINADPDFGGFCCRRCHATYVGGVEVGHGRKCARLHAGKGSRRAEPVTPERPMLPEADAAGGLAGSLGCRLQAAPAPRDRGSVAAVGPGEGVALIEGLRSNGADRAEEAAALPQEEDFALARSGAGKRPNAAPGAPQAPVRGDRVHLALVERGRALITITPAAWAAQVVGGGVEAGGGLLPRPQASVGLDGAGSESVAAVIEEEPLGSGGRGNVGPDIGSRGGSRGPVEDFAASPADHGPGSDDASFGVVRALCRHLLRDEPHSEMDGMRDLCDWIDAGYRQELDAVVRVLVGFEGIPGLGEVFCDLCSDHCEDGPDDPAGLETWVLVKFTVLVWSALPHKVAELDLVKHRSHSRGGLARPLADAAEDLARNATEGSSQGRAGAAPGSLTELKGGAAPSGPSDPGFESGNGSPVNENHEKTGRAAPSSSFDP